MLVTDDQGFLVPDSGTVHLTGVWRTLADRATQAYQTHLGDSLHSVYVRGSAARGLAVPGLSDLDTWALVSGDLEGPLVQVPDWAEGASQALLQGQSDCVDLELCVSPLDRVLSGRRSAHARALLKLSAVCVWGPDLRPSLPRCRPDPSLHAAVFFLADALARTRQELADDDDLDGVCLWLGKTVLRSAFELVMPLEGTWTRDLHWCWAAWARHHPESAESLRRVAVLALTGDDRPHTVASLLAEPAVTQVAALAAALGPPLWATD